MVCQRVKQESLSYSKKQKWRFRIFPFCYLVFLDRIPQDVASVQVSFIDNVICLNTLFGD